MNIKLQSKRFGCAAVAVISLLATVPACPAAKTAGSFGSQPVLLNWNDRRPLGRMFLCRVHSGWEKNPRGYLNDKRMDVTTPKGLADFHSKVLAKAQSAVDYLKQVDAQGVVVWDIEGQEMPHAISYIGDPRVLPEIAPEMDAVADDFFSVFTKNGMRTGLTIRPTKVVRDEEGKWPWKHSKVHDPVEEMAEKIRYARKRWGCTLFYIDSNVSRQVLGDYPWVLPAYMMGQLLAEFPDVLLIPEWETNEYYRYGVPYKDWWDGFSTPPSARQRFPQAFSVFVPKAQEVADHYHEVVDAMEKGDTAWVDAGFTTRLDNQVVEMLQQEIQLKSIPRRDSLRKAYEQSVDVMRTSLPKDIHRVQGLLSSPNHLIRRNALEALGRIEDKKATQALIDVLGSRDRLMIPFAITALGRQGSYAVPELKKAFLSDEAPRGKKTKVLTALGKTKSAEAHAFLISLLETNPDGPVTRVILNLLKDFKHPASVSPMLKMLKDSDPRYRGLVIDVLQEVGNAEAMAGLLAHVYSEDVSLRNKSRAALKYMADNMFGEMLNE